MKKKLRLFSNKDKLPLPPRPKIALADALVSSSVPTSSPVSPKEGSREFRILQYSVAILLAAIYVIAIWKLFELADSAKTQHWDRLLFLFNGVETIGFAAIGFILGTEIQRRSGAAQVAEAKNDALKAEAEKKAIETQLDIAKRRL